jgi:hypothetical protein
MTDRSALGKILLNGVELALEDVRAHPMDYEKLFEEARTSARPAPGYAECLCQKSRPKLKISRVFTSSEDRTVVGYTLRRWPSTAVEAEDVEKLLQQEANKHAPGCFYDSRNLREDPTSNGETGESLPAIEAADDDKRNVHADFPIDELINPAPPGIDAGPNSKGGSGGKRRQRAALQTLLFTIWEGTGMHVWKANWTRNWGTVYHHTALYASYLLVNGQADRIFISPPFFKNQKKAYDQTYKTFWNPLWDQAKQAQNAVLDTEAPTERWPLVIVIGELKSWVPASIRLKSLKFEIEASPEKTASIQRRFPRAFQGGEIAENVIGAFVVRPIPTQDVVNERDRLQLVDAVLSRSTSKFILVDSSYEAQVAELMVKNNRAFRKPLLGYDEEYRPDFLLLDVGAKPMIMEVYGITGDPDYDDRKNEKRALYKESGHKVWEWDLQERGDIPPLPEKPSL